VCEMENRTKRIMGYLFAVSLIIVVISGFFIHKHVIFPWDEIPIFNAVYGFISCVLIILISKEIGHKWLMKPEDYYDD